MEDINKLINANSKFAKLAGPLRAAQVCDTARSLANGRFEVISFREGLLTLGVDSSAAANNLRFIEKDIIKEINSKLTKSYIEKIRIKMI